MSEVEIGADNKISIRVLKKSGWLPAGHDGEARYSHTFERLTVQRESSSGMLRTGLAESDERRLEKLLNLKEGALSKYNSEFWDKFHFDVTSKGRTLDLKNPRHELEYKVMLVHTFFANSELERKDTPSAKYVLSSALEEAKEEGAKTKTRREAYKKFSNMSNQELIDVHNVINPTKKLSTATNVDLVQSAVEKIVIENPELFLSTLVDTTFKMKAFIDKCVQAKVMNKIGPKYSLHGGEKIGSSLAEALDYLNNPENQDVYINLKTKLETKD